MNFFSRIIFSVLLLLSFSLISMDQPDDISSLINKINKTKQDALVLNQKFDNLIAQLNHSDASLQEVDSARERVQECEKRMADLRVQEGRNAMRFLQIMQSMNDKKASGGKDLIALAAENGWQDEYSFLAELMPYVAMKSYDLKELPVSLKKQDCFLLAMLYFYVDAHEYRLDRASPIHKNMIAKLKKNRNKLEVFDAYFSGEIRDKIIRTRDNKKDQKVEDHLIISDLTEVVFKYFNNLKSKPQQKTSKSRSDGSNNIKLDQSEKRRSKLNNSDPEVLLKDPEFDQSIDTTLETKVGKELCVEVLKFFVVKTIYEISDAYESYKTSKKTNCCVIF